MHFEAYFHSFLLFWITATLNFLKCYPLCLEEMSLEPVSAYSGKIPTQGVKVTKTINTLADCVEFCVFIGDKTSFVYDSNSDTCYCHNLPLSMLEMSPSPGAVAVGAQTTPEDIVILWIASVIDESSHFEGLFGATKYQSTKMIGPADYYPGYGNTQKAWCPEVRNKQYVELAISESIFITELHIYEVFHAGGVQFISIRDPNSEWMEVWRTPQLENIQESRIFSPNFIPPDFKSNAIRIDLDLSITNAWSEYDAVRVIGTRTRKRTTLM